MVKVWCENCQGTGSESYIQMVSSTQFTGVFNGVNARRKCPICQGEGYTEEAVVKVGEVRDWADKNNSVDSYQRRMLRLSELRDWLDVQEEKNG